MTEEQIVVLGMYAENLMNEDNFNVLVQQFDQQCFLHWSSSEAHETKKREGIFAQRAGLFDFLAHMKAVIDEKTAIMERQAPSQADAHIEGID